MPRDSLNRATQALVARFRRQRPLRSGSLLVTMIGDAIAPRGGGVTLGSLIRLAQPFGLPERLVRTSVGRLASDGWLVSRRAGRQSEYTLSRHGRARFAEATQRIYGEAAQEWDQRWTLVMLGAQGKRRERIREEMLWLGFGQLSPGVLAHPNRSVANARRQLREIGMGNHAIVLRAESGGLEQDRRLIASGWDLGELARGYRRFVAAFGPVRAILARGATPDDESAFVIRTLLIHEYRRIHLRDPLLPASLLPQRWIGETGYALCQDLYRRVFDASEKFLSERAVRLNGPLAPFAADARGRFGGLRAG